MSAGWGSAGFEFEIRSLMEEVLPRLVYFGKRMRRAGVDRVVLGVGRQGAHLGLPRWAEGKRGECLSIAAA